MTLGSFDSGKSLVDLDVEFVSLAQCLLWLLPLEDPRQLILPFHSLFKLALLSD